MIRKLKRIRYMTVGEHVAESFEAQAKNIPPWHKEEIEILLSMAKLERETHNSKMVFLREWEITEGSNRSAHNRGERCANLVT